MSFYLWLAGAYFSGAISAFGLVVALIFFGASTSKLFDQRGPFMRPAPSDTGPVHPLDANV